MQVRFTRRRLAGEPADVMIRPRLSHVAPMDFDHPAESIAAGQRAAEQTLPEVAEKAYAASILQQASPGAGMILLTAANGVGGRVAPGPVAGARSRMLASLYRPGLPRPE